MACAVLLALFIAAAVASASRSGVRVIPAARFTASAANGIALGASAPSLASLPQREETARSGLFSGGSGGFDPLIISEYRVECGAMKRLIQYTSKASLILWPVTLLAMGVSGLGCDKLFSKGEPDAGVTVVIPPPEPEVTAVAVATVDATAPVVRIYDAGKPKDASSDAKSDAKASDASVTDAAIVDAAVIVDASKVDAAIAPPIPTPVIPGLKVPKGMKLPKTLPTP
jgi:hypothetical protein